MAKHEGRDEKKHNEHPRTVRRPHRRARGGATAEPELEDRFTEEELHDSEKPASERARGGSMPHHGRKHGGEMRGEAPKHRPDRRARGGHVESARERYEHEVKGGREANRKLDREHPHREGEGERRRARGGSVASDQHPISSAGKMSTPEYESQPQTSVRGDEGGKGNDRD